MEKVYLQVEFPFSIHFTISVSSDGKGKNKGKIVMVKVLLTQGQQVTSRSSYKITTGFLQNNDHYKVAIFKRHCSFSNPKNYLSSHGSTADYQTGPV
jgi:hypothetical protein